MNDAISPLKRNIESLRSKAAALPRSPGVYIMRDASNKVIYVGKSRSLRDRVSQYFHGTHDAKTEKMASNVADFNFITCDTEMEAFALENSLIKQHSPKYNIKLKDAKSYPYIKLTYKNDYPRISMSRTRTSDGSMYFGPYSSTGTVFSIISSLEKTLGIPSCKKRFPSDIGKTRPCVNYQIGRCAGLCTGAISKEEYRKTIDNAVKILRGGARDAIASLTEDMYLFSSQMQYEKAAKCRDTIKALEKLNERQKVVGSPSMECDVIGLCAANDVSSAHDGLSIFYIRSGCISDAEHFLFDDSAITLADDKGALEDESPIASFISGLYRRREYIPHEILLSFELSENDTTQLERYLSSLAERKVILKTPKRGASKYLCDMVVNDAKTHTEAKVSSRKATEKMLFQLSKMLSLEVFPDRIEAYDISNLGSEHITAGMIVASSGKLNKSEYRTFNIRSINSPDDYAAMREAITRRMALIDDPSANGTIKAPPDLILLDGGIGHVNVIIDALSEQGYSVPVFGMVKDDYHKTRTLVSPDGEIDISKQTNVFRFIYSLQEEVHRFTIGRMKKAKTRSIKSSSLEKISGIGPAKAKKLLKHFGKIENIKNAAIDEIKSAPGISEADAVAVHSHFHSKNNSR